jgi:hypothetical protein
MTEEQLYEISIHYTEMDSLALPRGLQFPYSTVCSQSQNSSFIIQQFATNRKLAIKNTASKMSL